MKTLRQVAPPNAGVVWNSTNKATPPIFIEITAAFHYAVRNPQFKFQKNQEFSI